MGFHGVQLLGFGLIGFGIFWQIRGWNYFHLPNYLPFVGILVVIVGLFLDPILDTVLEWTVLRRFAQVLSKRDEKGV